MAGLAADCQQVEERFARNRDSQNRDLTGLDLTGRDLQNRVVGIWIVGSPAAAHCPAGEAALHCLAGVAARLGDDLEDDLGFRPEAGVEPERAAQERHAELDYVAPERAAEIHENHATLREPSRRKTKTTRASPGRQQTLSGAPFSLCSGCCSCRSTFAILS